MRTASRLRLVDVVGAVLAVAVFAFGLGSSSVVRLHQIGSHLKWLSLAALVIPAGALVLRSRPFRLPAPVVLALSAMLLAAALESALWSVDPGATIKKAASLGLLLLVCALLGAAVAASPSLAAPVAVGIVAGTTAYALGGFVLLAVSESDAVQLANPGTPARFRGLSENPNTISLLCALVLPIAVWAVIAARTALLRTGAIAAVVLLYLAVALAGSRGALLALLIGLVPLVLLIAPGGARRFALVAGVSAAFAFGVGVSELSILTNPTIVAPSAPVAGGVKGVQTPAALGSPAADWTLLAHRMSDEIGSGDAGPRRLLGDSGRLAAWLGAIGLGAERAVVGYGFGTEGMVFVDRWAAFDGGLPENSYIGIFLQLGIVGLLLLLGLAVAIADAGRRALAGRDRALAAALVCTGIAGATLALLQSYVYAVGNLATLPLWVAAFLLAGLAVNRKVAARV